MLSADNQQERLRIEGWVAGFVDGEGCFSISIFRNPTTTSGWQVFPEFVVTQGARSLEALETVQRTLGCGSIYRNRRYDNHTEDLYRYCVRSLCDLRTMVVPFFRCNSLRTAKALEFERFAKALELIAKRGHLTEDGLAELRAIMNKPLPEEPGSSESSETVRRAPKRVKIQSEPSGD